MKKKIISILIAASLAATAAANVFAVSDDIKSTDKEVLTQMLTNMSSSERAAFINENLDIKLQHLSTLVTLSSNRAYDKIADEVKAALDDGLTSAEIKEAIYHSAAYCGYTRAAGALDAADIALKALGQDITYKSRITSTEENRYADGLAMQRTLFGPQIGTITDGMEESLKMQTLFLSGICFGDFYNRSKIAFA
ncbi:MAG: carboxymuconolactone decarboxylase family protein [Hominilimicola sp.]